MPASISRRRMMRTAMAATIFAGYSAGNFRPINAASRARQGLALCIGVNDVDPKYYSQYPARLSGCKTDMNNMVAIAESRGFAQAIPLFNENANIRNVRNHIMWAAHLLRSGDIFLLSCSSHGSQRTDTNGDEKDDGWDETICLYDGRWVDDDRLELFTRFAPGVRILLVVDACHSASTAKVVAAEEAVDQAKAIEAEKRPREVSRDLGGALDVIEEQKRMVESSYAALANSVKKFKGKLDAAKPAEIPRDGARRRLKDGTGDFGAQFDLGGDETSPFRALPDELSLFLDQFEDEYPGVPRSDSMAKLKAGVGVVSLAACQDDESAMDVRLPNGGYGVFTNTLKGVWNNGSFSGDYTEFFESVARPIKAIGKQHPVKLAFGDVSTFLRERPFSVG